MRRLYFCRGRLEVGWGPKKELGKDSRSLRARRWWKLQTTWDSSPSCPHREFKV